MADDNDDIQLRPDDSENAALGNRQEPDAQASRLPSDLPPPGETRPQSPPPETPPRHPVFERALEILRETMPPPGVGPLPLPGEREGVRADISDISALSPPTPPLAPPPLQPSAFSPLPSHPAVIPARMLNEFVYCPRLFYYEFVEGVFVESADTVRGKTLHRRVDSGQGDLPPAAEKKSEGRKQKAEQQSGTLELPLVDTPNQDAGRATLPQSPDSPETPDARPETLPPPSTDTIHSRSVQMGSDRLGVTAKMDLVEVRASRRTPVGASDVADLFAGHEALEVVPVDYKIGAPREGDTGNELWDADRMQLGVQALILRDNGYTCHEGVIYYRETKQRVRLPITPALVAWVEERIIAARHTAAGAIPAPLVASRKCPRCSLAPVCLPDETRLLAELSTHPTTGHPLPSDGRGAGGEGVVRRLIAARDDSRALYLSTPGLRVGRQDEVLQIKQEKSLLDEVRINDVSHLALFGNIQITTQAVQTLCEMEVPVTYFSMGGWFYGVTRGHALKNIFLRIEQFRLARDPATCLRLAQQFVHGKIRNHRTMLMRNHLEAPPDTLLKLKQCADAALRAESIESLLGTEGAAAAAYFAQFDGMIKVADDADNQLEGAEVAAQKTFRFEFNGRNRRPPTDPVNALLSLAYSLLSKDCLLAALAVGFDPYLGFYHQPRFGRPALALDLMEEFRPLVAESAVLSCINNRVVNEGDFVRAGQAVNLTPAGRKRFFNAYEQRMNSLLTHPIFDYKVSYRRALELQARLLAKTLTGEIPEYVPLTTR